MKKQFIYIISFIVLLSTITICYAGDVPEGLLANDNAQVYFGEVKTINNDSITVIQRKNIKGSFEQDHEISYTRFSLTASPQVGKQYLCGFYNDNSPLYIWEVTSLETNTLKIKNNDYMSQRMQEYLNSGAFAKKEQERLLLVEASKSLIEENTITQISLFTWAISVITIAL